MTLNLNTWTGVVPVLLPWGEPTLSTVGVASTGVAVPFFCYVVAMFMVIVPIWMNNFESDKREMIQQGGLAEGTQFTSISIENQTIRDFPKESDYMGYPDVLMGGGGGANAYGGQQHGRRVMGY